MNDFVACRICFLKPGEYMRQCYCVYCKDCVESSKSLCQCGGTGGWAEITSEIKKQFLNFGESNKFIISHLYENLTDRVNSAISQLGEYLENTGSIKKHQSMRKFQILFKKLRDLEDESKSLKENKGLENFEIQSIGKKVENFKQGFDFSPFEELLKQKNK